ncbi:aromatic acid exporter family protein [Kineococcus gynurae]|uniref:Aromatic acid exporter family protein n=1 Tax=Kineococcus gynurae TaxID=452979 RepID=A0ABV5LS05_9ACTN
MPSLAPTLLALRRRLRAGAQRALGSYWQVLQCGIGAGAAWVLAQALWGQPYPVFACVAAVVSLGVTNSQRLHRVGELGVGVTLGVILGTLLTQVIGHGPVQIAVLVVLAMTLARFLDGGNLIVNQAALQALFISALPPQPGGGYGRWLDAMTGVVVAVVIAALLPQDARRDIRGRARAFTGQLADILEDTAEAVRRRDPVLGARALELARDTQPRLDRWAAAVTAASEVHRLTPLRRGRHEMPELARTQRGLDRATRNLRVAVRRVNTALEYDEQLPVSLAAALDEMAACIRAVHEPPFEGDPRPPAAELLQELAYRLGPAVLGAESLSATVVVAQLRSAVVDLLETMGMTRAEAHALLPR